MALEPPFFQILVHADLSVAQSNPKNFALLKFSFNSCRGSSHSACRGAKMSVWPLPGMFFPQIFAKTVPFLQVLYECLENGDGKK